LLHDNAPAHKAASVCQFFTPKTVTTLYSTPILNRFISARLFSVPHVENEVAEIQEAVTDELKKVQKRNFRQLFRKCTIAQKPVYMPMELILNKKSYVSSILKKISPKTFEPRCICLLCA